MTLASLHPGEAALPSQPFVDPDPFQEITFPSPLAAKRAIADELGQPLAKLSAEQLRQIDELLTQTLDKQQVLAQVRAAFKPIPGRCHAQ